MSTGKQNPVYRRELRAGLVMALGATALMSGVSLGAETDQSVQKADDNACLFSVSVNDWRALDSRNLVIWAPNRKDAYHVTLGFPLHDLKGVDSIAIVDGDRDGRLCGFGRDEIATHSGAFPEHASVMGMTRLDEAGLVALGEQYKVKLVNPPKDRPVK